MQYLSAQPSSLSTFTGCAVNSFIDQGEFVAMKTLSDHRAPHYHKHQFSELVLEPFSRYCCST